MVIAVASRASFWPPSSARVSASAARCLAHVRPFGELATDIRLEHTIRVTGGGVKR